MATGAISTLPPGYTIEGSQGASTSTLPPGYTIEGQQPSASGPSIGPQPNASSESSADLARDVSGGNPANYAVARLTMPAVKALIRVHDAIKSAEGLTQEGREAHPITAKLGDTAAAIEGLLIGNTDRPDEAIGTGKYGILNNPATAAILAPEVGGEAVKGIEEATEATGSTEAAAKEGPGIIKQIRQGKAVEQEPAQTSLRGAAKNVGAEERPSAPMRTLLDKPIAKTAKAERDTYDTLNKAAGADLKSLYDQRSELEDAIEDPTNILSKQKLNVELNRTDMQIKNAEAKATDNGVDPKTLNDAKALTQRRYALEDVKKKLFNNESVVSGNAKFGADEQINVDSAIRQVENLDKPSKYAPEGSPSRLRQALGDKGADQLLQNLYDAQKAGQKALRAQRIVKWIGAGLPVAGGSIEIMNKFSGSR